MRRVLALVAATLAAAATIAASPPRPTTSEFLISTGAGFLFGEGLGAYYAMNYSVRKPLPGDLSAVVVFDNPENPASPLRTETTVDAGAKEIAVRSPPVHALTNGKLYNVRLLLYADADHAHLLSTHGQAVLFQVPTQVAQQLYERFGVTVR